MRRRGGFRRRGLRAGGRRGGVFKRRGGYKRGRASGIKRGQWMGGWK